MLGPIRMDARFRDLEQMQTDYKKALKEGKVDVFYSRVMLIGPAGAGKSSLLRGLMNLKLDEMEDSTLLALLYLVWAEGTSEEGCWKKVTEQDEIRELAELVKWVVNVEGTEPVPCIDSDGITRFASRIKRWADIEAVRAFPIEEPSAPPTQPTEIDSVSFTTTRQPPERDPEPESYAQVVKQIFQRIFDYIKDQGTKVSSSPLQSDILLRVWDCGGQPVFLDVLPAFLTLRTIFFLLYDASKPLDSKYVVQWRKGGVVVREEEEIITVLQLLQQWMAAIHARFAEQDPDGSLPAFPRIVPIGTHGDDQNVKERKSEIIQDMMDACMKMAYRDLLLPGIIVDNTTAGRGAGEDEAYQHIRDLVRKYACTQLKMETPVAWVLFRKVLQQVTEQTKKNVISYSLAVAIAVNTCQIPANVVPSMLKFYHEFGVLLYYGGIPAMCDYVVANPQWLVDQLAMLLAPNERDPALQYFWKLLQEKGILLQPLYQEIWRNSGIKPQALVEILESCLLAAPIRTTGQHNYRNCREYFVPSVLQLQINNAHAEVQARAPSNFNQAAPLHITFNTGYIPPGFFARLAASLTKHEGKTKCNVIFRDGIFRNRVTYKYGYADQIDEIIVSKSRSFTSIQVDVVRRSMRKPHHPTFHDICRNVFDFLESCCEEVQAWFPSITATFAFPCDLPECQRDDDKHFIDISREALAESTFRCQRDQLYQNVTPAQKYWLKTFPQARTAPANDGELEQPELLGVANEISNKLDDLAAQLEMMYKLQEIKSDPRIQNKAFYLLWIWSQDMGTRYRLATHLRQINLTSTADKLLSGVWRKQNSESGKVLQAEPCKPLELVDLYSCSQKITSDPSKLAIPFKISTRQMEIFREEQDSPEGQAYMMLEHYWKNSTGSRKDLEELLYITGFAEAAEILRTE